MGIKSKIKSGGLDGSGSFYDVRLIKYFKKPVKEVNSCAEAYALLH
jgi:hypothetical protein